MNAEHQDNLYRHRHPSNPASGVAILNMTGEVEYILNDNERLILLLRSNSSLKAWETYGKAWKACLQDEEKRQDYLDQLVTNTEELRRLCK